MKDLFSRKIGECSIGSWISLGDPFVAEIMAKAGFQWLAVDLEHSAISISRVARLIQIVDLCGSIPLVRMPGHDPLLVKRVLDSGAKGIITPMVNTVSDAVNAYRAIKYQPEGIRGVGLFRAQGFGKSRGFEKYFRDVEKNRFLNIIQIEHVKGVENIISILETGVVDGVFIGPYDLSCSIGCPGQFSDPTFRSALSEVHDACEKYGIGVGIHLVEPDPIELNRLISKDQYDFIAYSVDFRMIENSAVQATSLIRGHSK